MLIADLHRLWLAVCMSTLAGGDVTNLSSGSNIVFIPAIVDIAGINRLSRIQIHSIGRRHVHLIAATSRVSYRAIHIMYLACAVVGMVNGVLHREVQEQKAPKEARKRKPVILASMFGNTTTCVDHARKLLTEEYGYEVLVFHAVGAFHFMQTALHRNPLLTHLQALEEGLWK